MAHKKIDLVDAAVSPAFVLSAAISVGIISGAVYGFDLADPLISSSGAEISTAKIISILTIGTAYVTNRPDFSMMGFVETTVAVMTIGLVLLPPFMPILDGLLGVTGAGLIAVLIQSAGFYTLAYLG